MLRPSLSEHKSHLVRWALVICIGSCLLLPAVPSLAAPEAPSLSGVAASLGREVAVLQKLISEMGVEGSASPGGAGGDLAGEVAALRVQVEQLISKNEALSADHDRDKADLYAILKDYEDLRQRYEALTSQKDDSDDKAVQLETALMLIDAYEQTISRLDARVAELEEKLALLGI